MRDKQRVQGGHEAGNWWSLAASGWIVGGCIPKRGYLGEHTNFEVLLIFSFCTISVMLFRIFFYFYIPNKKLYGIPTIPNLVFAPKQRPDRIHPLTIHPSLEYTRLRRVNGRNKFNSG